MSGASLRHPSLLDASHLHLGTYLSGERNMEDQRRCLVHAAFLRHVDENASFARYAEKISAMDLHDPDILFSATMPLLPSSLFKRDDLAIRSVAADAIVKRCLSSGTSGSVSRVDRDEATLLNFVTTITAALPPLLSLDRTGDYAAIVLGPSTEDVGDLWFSYVISCLGLMMPTTYCEVDGLFDAERAARVTRDHVVRGEPYVLIGPPHRVLEVCRSIGTLNRSSQDRSFAISAGGWKGLAADSIPPAAFRTMVASALQLASETQVRDNFNMVELNTVLFECEHHRKHLPPWLLVQARDPDTHAVLPSGSAGVLSFMDAGATSYPCFILGEDFGSVDQSVCTCGRYGGTLSVHRRINRVEQRGCALKMSGGRAAADGGADRFHTSVYR